MGFIRDLFKKNLSISIPPYPSHYWRLNPTIRQNAITPPALGRMRQIKKKPQAVRLGARLRRWCVGIAGAPAPLPEGC